MRQTTGDLIYEKLRTGILYLRREPGAELNLTELCEEFDVSRSPVRDALVRLREDGLVDLRPQRGCRITKIDLGLVDEELFLRQSLEKGVLLRCRDSLKRSDVARMEYYIQLQREAAENEDREAFFTAMDSIYEVLYRSAGLERTWSLIQCETGNHRRLCVLSMSGAEGLERAIKEEEQLVGALKAGDFDLAASLDADSLCIPEDRLEEITGSYPEYFISRRTE